MKAIHEALLLVTVVIVLSFAVGVAFTSMVSYLSPVEVLPFAHADVILSSDTGV